MKKLGGLSRTIYDDSVIPGVSNGNLTMEELGNLYEKVRTLPLLPLCEMCGKKSKYLYFSIYGFFGLCNKHKIKESKKPKASIELA